MADAHTLLWQHLERRRRGCFRARSRGRGLHPAILLRGGASRDRGHDDPFKHREDGARERWQERHRVDIMQVPPAHVLRNASEVAEAILDIASRRKERFGNNA